MRILLAIDKFKGSLTSQQAATAVVRGFEKAGVEAQFEISMLADGGDGFTATLADYFGAEWQDVRSVDAQQRPIDTRYAIMTIDGRRVAVMEMSATSGLAQVADLQLNPNTATTYGVGVLLKHAWQQGVHEVLMGIGGSATNDGGIGMLQALGAKFKDVAGNELSDLPFETRNITQVELQDLPELKITVACDVDNPLLGERGATAIYGMQKGVKDFEFYEERMSFWADLIESKVGQYHRQQAGAGAAGGLGFALLAALGAQLRPGFDLIADLLGLEKRIQEVDLVITGEGRMDAQTLHGKGPHGVALLAKKYGKKVVGIAGSIDAAEELNASFDGLIAVKPEAMPLPDAMQQAALLIEDSVAKQATWLINLARNSA